jgi:hypothetical protein
MQANVFAQAGGAQTRSAQKGHGATSLSDTIEIGNIVEATVIA